MFEYEGLRRKTYGDGDELIAFVPVCPTCGRFVAADKSVSVTDAGPQGTNATCSRCGRVEMPCDGWFSRGELRTYSPRRLPPS